MPQWCPACWMPRKLAYEPHLNAPWFGTPLRNHHTLPSSFEPTFNEMLVRLVTWRSCFRAIGFLYSIINVIISKYSTRLMFASFSMQRNHSLLIQRLSGWLIDCTSPNVVFCRFSLTLTKNWPLVNYILWFFFSKFLVFLSFCWQLPIKSFIKKVFWCACGCLCVSVCSVCDSIFSSHNKSHQSCNTIQTLENHT